MNIGLIGFGGVGKALVKLLLEKESYLIDKYNLTIKVKYIIKSNGGIYNPNGIRLDEVCSIIENNKDISEHLLWIDKLNIDSIIKSDDIDTLVELTSTNIIDGEPGLTHIKKALDNNINVVTGNKGPILLRYKELKELAERKYVTLKVGCTTGGALPSINGGLYDIAGSEVLSIEGILNGTTNFILSEMLENDISYKTALKKAQELGIAELNPKLDVEGFDTAAKIIILSNVIMNTDICIEDIDVEGITEVIPLELKRLKSDGKKLKLIGKVIKESENVKVSVRLEEIGQNHPLYFVDYKNKGIYFKTDTLGDISLIGGASGTMNAAASILRDIVLVKGSL